MIVWYTDNKQRESKFCLSGRFENMEKTTDEKLRKILQEVEELLKSVYGNRLKAVILYGSVARGTQTEDSDIDIMVLVDGTDEQLR